jgi:hypothetical protein
MVMKVQCWAKNYEIKCDAIGNILRNTLGTWEPVENTHWENGGNTKIQRTPASPSLASSFDFLGMFSK